MGVKTSSEAKTSMKANVKEKAKNPTKPEGKSKAAAKEKATTQPTTLSGAGSIPAATAPASSVVEQKPPAVTIPADPEEVILTDAEGRRYCRSTDCDQIGIVDGYCRYHYLYFWKKIQVRKKILADGKLERYIEELTARYTDKFIELLRKDLRTEKDFLAAVQELELDDSSSGSGGDEDEAKNYIEEISGVQSESRDDDSY